MQGDDLKVLSSIRHFLCRPLDGAMVTDVNMWALPLHILYEYPPTLVSGSESILASYSSLRDQWLSPSLASG